MSKIKIIIYSLAALLNARSFAAPTDIEEKNTTIKKQNILLVFPKFDNLSLTDRRVVAGIKVAYQNDAWAQKNFNLVESSATIDIPHLIKKTLEDVDTHKPVLIIGAVTSNIAFALSEVAETKKIPFISPFATNAQLTEGKNYTFTTCFNDNFQAANLARSIWRDKHRKGIVFTNTTSSYSIGFSKIFTETFTKLGGALRTVDFATLNDGTVDHFELSQTSSKDNLFVLIPSYQVEAANLISRIYAKFPLNTKYYGGDSWGGGSVFHSVIKEISSQFHGQYVQHWSMEAKTPSNALFMSQLKSANLDKSLSGNTTAMIAPIAMGYDSALVAFQALKRSKNFQPENIVKSMRTVDVTGASGRITYPANSHSPKKGFYIYELTSETEKLSKFISPGDDLK